MVQNQTLRMGNIPKQEDYIIWSKGWVILLLGRGFTRINLLLRSIVVENMTKDYVRMKENRIIYDISQISNLGRFISEYVYVY